MLIRKATFPVKEGVRHRVSQSLEPRTVCFRSGHDLRALGQSRGSGSALSVASAADAL